jgi:hypothetical protein
VRRLEVARLDDPRASREGLVGLVAVPVDVLLDPVLAHRRPGADDDDAAVPGSGFDGQRETPERFKLPITRRRA